MDSPSSIPQGRSVNPFSQNTSQTDMESMSALLLKLRGTPYELGFIFISFLAFNN